jgi:hypothetical protein
MPDVFAADKSGCRKEGEMNNKKITALYERASIRQATRRMGM